MPEPVTLTILTALIIKNAPSWLTTLRSTILGKSREIALDKGKELASTSATRLTNRILHLDEKEQLRHLQQALKNATERGLATFHTLSERDHYKDILYTLSQPGPQGETLRQEIMTLFTLQEQPDFTALNDLYNQRQRYSNAEHQNLDAAPYLASFFTALLGELYADTFFRSQLSDVLQLRAANSAQQSLLSIVDMLKNIGEYLQPQYTPEDLARDIEIYTTHIERTMRNLKIVGVVPKDQNADPELSGIFVSPRIVVHNQSAPDQPIDTIIAALEQYPCLVVLGGPGSGKSTLTKHLAWSHAATNQPSAPQTALLSGNPLPLRIELRRLSEERKRTTYDFLSFATEVLFKREGYEVNPLMFKELLSRRGMLLLFDGLDEVATLEERLDLVSEIEHFALNYPGNRVLVTSRPVGYDLARVSHPLFAHAEIQGFNDEQILQFLENWYTAVLRLSPIPQREQEELALLLATLKENPRLHKLAENPLLLTVITALHRYERLPDRRVLIYDRCADLLLETWSRLRGTDKRWKDMKMVKEDQYACVAHLAFVLHERSQEETAQPQTTPDETNEPVEDTTVDVTLRFLSKHVEDFLKKRKLITDIAGQRAEARRFIDLVREEAGLIVERGVDENGESLYGFVHRTFQEYFAAAEIYELYQQKEDPKVISNFLRAHLHDPHWREPILLLLGKLKSAPVTRQLQQILQGKIHSPRSRYTEIVQQDLFFICECLVEEIKVELPLVEKVIVSLSDVIKNSWSPSQKIQALQYLGQLMQTRQYTGRGKPELIAFATKPGLLDPTLQLEAILVFCLFSNSHSPDHLLASQTLTNFIQRPDVSGKQVREIAEFLHDTRKERSEENELGRSMLMELVQHPDLSVEERGETAEVLYWLYEKRLEGGEIGRLVLMELVQRTDLLVEERWQVAESLYEISEEESGGKEIGRSVLMELAQCPDLSVKQASETTEFFYITSKDKPERGALGRSVLMELVKRPELSAEEKWKIAESLYRWSEVGSEEEELGRSVLMELVKRPELSAEEKWKTAESLYNHSKAGSQEKEVGRMLLMELVKRPELSAEEKWKTAESLYRYSEEGSEARLLATSILLSYSTQLKNPDHDAYSMLHQMVPQFHKLPPINPLPQSTP